MSRIGRKPIAIPAGVNVTVDGNKVTVAGPKGTLDSTFHAKMAIAVEAGNVVVSRPDDTNESKALHGLTRTLISNMVTGVSEGFTKDLEVIGIDKQKVGQVAAEIREKRPPEPYKGKGIRYAGEYIIRKEGKTGKGK